MLTVYPTSDRERGRLKDAVWIDLLSPTSEEIEEVVLVTGLRVPTREEVSAIEASSRLQRVGQALYLSTSLMTLTEQPHLSPVGFVLTGERLVTVRFDHFGAFETAAEHAEEDGTITSLGVFTCVFESIVDRIADGLEYSATELDQVSRGIFHHKRRRRGTARADLYQRQMLVTVGRIGERLSQVRDVLLGVGRIVPFVLELNRDGADVPQDIVNRMKAVKQDIASLNDYEAHLANKVQFLLDAVLGFITIAQNDLFKVMTVWSIVGIPPTLMAGVWGMNFKNMPELMLNWGYPVGLIVIVLSGLIPLGWFKWKGWL